MHYPIEKEKAGARLNVSTMKAVNKDTLAQDVDAACEVFDKTEMDYKIWVTSSLAKFKLMQRIKEPEKLVHFIHLLREKHTEVSFLACQMLLSCLQKNMKNS